MTLNTFLRKLIISDQRDCVINVCVLYWTIQTAEQHSTTTINCLRWTDNHCPRLHLAKCKLVGIFNHLYVLRYNWLWRKQRRIYEWLYSVFVYLSTILQRVPTNFYNALSTGSTSSPYGVKFFVISTISGVLKSSPEEFCSFFTVVELLYKILKH